MSDNQLEIDGLLVWLADYDEDGFIDLMARLGYWYDMWAKGWYHELIGVN